MRALQVKEDHPDYIHPTNFQSHARDWGKLFMELFYDDDLTPYIHGMKIHVYKYLFLFLNFSMFNQLLMKSEYYLHTEIYKLIRHNLCVNTVCAHFP